MVGLGKFGALEYTAILDKSLATAYVYMVDFFPCTTGIGIPSPAVSGPSILNLRRFAKSSSMRSFHLLI